MSCLHACMCTSCKQGVCGGWKRVLDLLRLDSQMAVSHPVHAGNQTRIPRKGTQWTKLLSHLPLQPLRIFIFNFSRSKLQSLKCNGEGKNICMALKVLLIKTVITQETHSNPSGI